MFANYTVTSERRNRADVVGMRGRSRNTPVRGFTILEFVVVIVLLGIVGVTVVSRFTNPNSFNANAIRNVLLSSIRSAQQNAMGKTDVKLQINKVSNQWQIDVKAGTTTLETFSMSANNVKLETGSAATLTTPTDSCSSGTSFNVPVSNFELTFDTQGNIASFSNTTVGTETSGASFNGVRICVNDDVDASVCVSPAGFAYSGNCDE